MISTEKKNDVLNTLAGLLEDRLQEIIEANSLDLTAYSGTDESMYDRLKVDPSKVLAMIRSVKDAIALDDPEGKVLYTFLHENGLQIENRTVPFGKILIIYESRPDVTIEAAITAFKAGNKILLKGGKEARNSNLLLIDLWQKSLSQNGIDKDYIVYLDLDRTATQALIKTNSHAVDMIIPRGGEGLINFVKDNTDIPVIVSGRGNNFLYVDEFADFDMAIDIILDGKTRISVCNALDKVLVHENCPDLVKNLTKLVKRLRDKEIEVIGDPSISKMLKEVRPFEDPSIYYEEFLSAKILLSLTKNIDQAIDMVNTYSGKHSTTIVTSDAEKAQRFLDEVDSAAVYHNASTRFTDGGQFGFGAEMAISTQKLHFRGPIGIDQLVTNKWFIFGQGQTRS